MINLFFAVFQSPIQAFNGFCLQPTSSNCDPEDNTRLVYHKAARCKNNYMFFTYKNEVLIHTCSGKRVCPQGKYAFQDCSQSWKGGMRYGRMRARSTGKRRSREKQGLSPSERKSLLLFAAARAGLKRASKAASLICTGTKIFDFYPRRIWIFNHNAPDFLPQSQSTPTADLGWRFVAWSSMLHMLHIKYSNRVRWMNARLVQLT